MKKYEKLTKFIPALEAEGLGRWLLPEESASGALPEAEYQDVVFRFLDVLEAFAEKTPPKDPDAAQIVKQLMEIFGKEEEYPGVLIGYLENGTIVSLLRELEKK